jgi:uncharacterized protein YjbJ (UPF0337 family)
MENAQNSAAEAFKVQGNWEQQVKGLKTKFPQLTDNDLKLDHGKEDEMLKRVQSRLSKNREEVIALIRTNQSSKS